MIKESAGTCQRIFYATSLTHSRSIVSDIEVYKIQSLPSVWRQTTAKQVNGDLNKLFSKLQPSG